MEVPRGFSQSPCLLGSCQESEETQTFFQPHNLGGCSDGYHEHAVSLQILHSRGRFHTLSLFFPPPLDLERLAPSCWEAISAEDKTSSTGVAGATGWGAKRKKKKKKERAAGELNLGIWRGQLPLGDAKRTALRGCRRSSTQTLDLHRNRSSQI